MRNSHAILFELFKQILWELQLNTITKMNQLMTITFKSLMSREKKMSSKHEKLMFVCIDCFHHFVRILSSKLGTGANTNMHSLVELRRLAADLEAQRKASIEIDEVLLMFDGIVQFLINGLYVHSQAVTEKIYSLLGVLLDIKREMAELVSISLYKSIRSNFSPRTQIRTQKILRTIFDQLHPVIFIKVVIHFSYKDGNAVKVRKRKALLIELVKLITAVLIERMGETFDQVSSFIFSDNLDFEIFSLWIMDPISLITMSCFNYQFSLANRILESEVSKISGKIKPMKEFVKMVEGVMVLVNSQSFVQRASAISNKKVQLSLMKFLGSLIMICEYKPVFKELIVKFKNLHSGPKSMVGRILSSKSELKSDEEEILIGYYLENRGKSRLGSTLSLEFKNFEKISFRRHTPTPALPGSNFISSNISNEIGRDMVRNATDLNTGKKKFGLVDKTGSML